MGGANKSWHGLLPLLWLVACPSWDLAQDKGLEWVPAGKDNKTFVLETAGRRFAPWSFNGGIT
jgi:hypothetical protein